MTVENLLILIVLAISFLLFLAPHKIIPPNTNNNILKIINKNNKIISTGIFVLLFIFIKSSRNEVQIATMLEAVSESIT